MSKTKYFCGTLNNWTNDELINLNNLGTSARCTYIVIGKEGADSTPHLQFYIEFNVRTTFSQGKRLMGSRVHIEKRLGTALQAADYCKKEGDWTEQGEISKDKSGHRSDLDSLKESLNTGMGLVEVSDEHFASFMKYRRSIVTYINLHAAPRHFKTTIVVYWGKTGSGKTRRAYDESLSTPYTHPGGQWFDGYQGQEIAIFDDFGGSEFKLTYFLKLLDRYPMKVPIKGEFVEWRPKKIYITSNKDPRTWYSHAHPEHIEAMFRRFDIVEEMN